MPGPAWFSATASFLGKWEVMMAAMMLPCLVPMLWRYRMTAAMAGAIRLGRMTVLAAAAYFLIWASIGAVAYIVDVVLATAESLQPTLAQGIPVAKGMIVLAAGALQLTVWKARQLACCREVPENILASATNAGTAWRYGLRLGIHCSYCCAGPVTVLFAAGIMNLRAMALVAVAIILERLAPRGERVAKVTGVVAVAIGTFMIAQALWHA